MSEREATIRAGTVGRFVEMVCGIGLICSLLCLYVLGLPWMPLAIGAALLLYLLHRVCKLTILIGRRRFLCQPAWKVLLIRMGILGGDRVALAPEEVERIRFEPRADRWNGPLPTSHPNFHPVFVLSGRDREVTVPAGFPDLPRFLEALVLLGPKVSVDRRTRSIIDLVMGGKVGPNDLAARLLATLGLLWEKERFKSGLDWLNGSAEHRAAVLDRYLHAGRPSKEDPSDLF